MSRIVPFRKARPTSRAKSQAPSQAPSRWFPIALVALPLAAFTAVLLLPAGGGGREAAGAVVREGLAEEWGGVRRKWC